MPRLSSIMTDLKKKGTAQTRKIYSRHGMDPDRVLGVSIADLKVIAKSVKGQQALAQELYATGTMEAMYLACLVADGARLSREQLNEWVEWAAGLQTISEYSVPWVTVDRPDARVVALEWMRSKEAHIAAAGWNTYSGLVSVLPDEVLDFAEIQSLLDTVVEEIGSAPNRVRCTMNGFVISVGGYVKPILKQAKAAAGKIGAVQVDVGDTECKIPLALEYIEKIEGRGSVGKKRKTVRC
jgi:hypothetical protein